MILQKRQEYLNSVFKNIEAINRRRAYISTRYVLARDRFTQTLTEDDKKEIEKYEAELEYIDSQITPLRQELRNIQTRYLVEYEGESVNSDTNESTLNHYKEELFFLVRCDIDTFSEGWDLEKTNAEELLYEISDYLLQHRFSRFLIRNIKRLH